MKNIDLLYHINSIVYKDQYSTYYVYIPLLQYNQDNTYIENFDNGIYVKLSQDFLEDSDIVSNFLDNEENREYEIITKADLDLYSLERIDSIKYEYYSKINKLYDKEIQEDMILNFYQTFLNTINTYAEVQNIEDIKTQIYKKVIDYYSNGQTDCVIRGLSLILQSSTYNYIDTGAYNNCGCNSAISSSNNSGQTTSTGLTTNIDCVTAYKQSMYLYLVQMLNDLDFYNNFMFVENEPNEDLLNYLIKLIDELKGMNFSLNFSETTNNHCLCSEIETKNINNYSILDNYQKVLNWIKNCEIEENTNKIKIYGKQFAELLPNLQF